MVDVEPADTEIIDLLRSRDSQATEVRLRDGQICTVFDIAWGYDIGDQYAHVTSNVSPMVEDRSIDFFFTCEIEQIVDPETGLVIFEAAEPKASLIVTSTYRYISRRWRPPKDESFRAEPSRSM